MNRQVILDPQPARLKAQLTYPVEAKVNVGDGKAVEVARGIHWLRMPMGGGMKSVNVYVLEDGEGWTVVDTGLRTESTAVAWSEALSGCLGGRPVRRVIATHMHPDHVGMAGWMLRKFPGSDLWMSRLEYLTCRVLAADTGREAPEEGVRFYHAAGWGLDEIETYRARFGGFGKVLYPLPDAYRRVADGEVVRIGEDDWRVVIGAGHSPEHVCLWEPQRKLLISGDQVLPRISSNVSVFPTEPGANPLLDWMVALNKLRQSVNNDVLVLPGHNEPFLGLHERIDELTRSHIDSLARLEEFLREPRRVIDAFPVLFSRPITADVLGLATGETLAHLSYLKHAARAEMTLTTDGVAFWTSV